jgi:hypothetical protein
MNVAADDLGNVLRLVSGIRSASLGGWQGQDLGVEVSEVRVVAVHILLKLKKPMPRVILEYKYFSLTSCSSVIFYDRYFHSTLSCAS